MKDIIEKASILVESLPYIRKFAGKTFVIKYGGHAMENVDLQFRFAEDVVLLKYVGINPIIVHGGGPQIGDFLKKLDIKSSFVSGMRVTDAATMEIVEMTLSGKVNREIVSLINKAGGKAIGLSGRDGQLIKARKLLVEGNDIGQVGEVESINREILDCVSNQFIPVIAPIGIGENYEAFNINADIAAGSIAAAIRAEKLLLLTDVDGVQDFGKKRLSTIKASEIDILKSNGTLYGGMIPKMDCAKMAVESGVAKAHILDGRMPHSVLLEIFTDSGVGTQVING